MPFLPIIGLIMGRTEIVVIAVDKPLIMLGMLKVAFGKNDIAARRQILGQ